ncbi:hypothetical protein [Methylophaga nitratireducenticrescens]|uniref:hypothetical protein n=1 Tax=Methylophaga nitratireducenticrescens TaxID=754476 RepID=UPI00146F6FC1|nr:hypothetical protein [Methylophaga nitratireducenticrescens]
MNAHTILNKLLHAVTANMHKIRREAVSDCVFSLMDGASATVTSIGRGLDCLSYPVFMRPFSEAAMKNSVRRPSAALQRLVMLRVRTTKPQSSFDRDL